jgi:hypothetical protein
VLAKSAVRSINEQQMATTPVHMPLLQVKMRDVLSLVNSILCVNSLALALTEGVPSVLQQHLDAMQQQVTQQLAPAGQGGTAAVQLQGQVSTPGNGAPFFDYCSCTGDMTVHRFVCICADLPAMILIVLHNLLLLRAGLGAGCAYHLCCTLAARHHSLPRIRHATSSSTCQPGCRSSLRIVAAGRGACCGVCCCCCAAGSFLQGELCTAAAARGEML